MSARAALTTAVLAALAASSVGQSQPAAPRQLPPVDEAASRPDFFTFRAQLQLALARRDVSALMEVVHPKIKNGFGGDDGKAGFEKRWRPEASDSEIWGTLAVVLALGGTFEGADTFIAPYVFSRWPGQVDSFEHVAVIGDRVRVRRAARPDALEMASSSFEILRRADDAGVPGWTAVRLPSGATGFIASKYVRSPIDYRAFFSKEAGRWRMMMLLAGD